MVSKNSYDKQIDKLQCSNSKKLKGLQQKSLASCV